MIIRTPQRLVGKRHRQGRWRQSFRFPQWNMSFFMGFFHSPEHGLRKDMLSPSWKMISRWWFQTCYIFQDAYFFQRNFNEISARLWNVLKHVETCWNMLKPSTRLWFTNKFRLKWTPFRPALRTSCEKKIGLTSMTVGSRKGSLWCPVSAYPGWKRWSKQLNAFVWDKTW